MNARKSEFFKSIGKVARRARLARGWTQEDAAEKIGVSAYFYACIERGRKSPSLETLARIADSFQISVDALLGTKELVLPELKVCEGELLLETPQLRTIRRRLRQLDVRAHRLINRFLDDLDEFHGAMGAPGEGIYLDGVRPDDIDDPSGEHLVESPASPGRRSDERLVESSDHPRGPPVESYPKPAAAPATRETYLMYGKPDDPDDLA